jgi:hypothetical protein
MCLYTGSRKSDALDLNVDPLGQLLHGDAAAGGLVDEPLGILLVHALFYVEFSMPRSHDKPRCRLLTAKLLMSVKKALTLTTFSIDEPASSRTALRLAMQAAVFS